MKIDKNIPIPGPRGAQAKYPWDELQVGDSFFAAASTASLQSCARLQKKKRGHDYTIRKDGDGCRVWRIA